RQLPPPGVPPGRSGSSPARFSRTSPCPPRPRPFPYTTLFRSRRGDRARRLRPASRGQGEARGRAAGSAHRPHGHRLRQRSSVPRSEEHTSELQSREKLVCRLLLEKKKKI